MLWGRARGGGAVAVGSARDRVDGTHNAVLAEADFEAVRGAAAAGVPFARKFSLLPPATPPASSPAWTAAREGQGAGAARGGEGESAAVLDMIDAQLLRDG
jgi:hypothetical protein